MDIEQLKKKRETQINGIFILMIQIAFVFGIPAVIAVLLGKYLSGGTFIKYIPFFLIIAFIFSWTIVIIMYKRKSQALNETEEQIKKLKNDNV